MEKIDWSEAPEGATHWEPEGECPASWMRKSDLGWEYWGRVSNKWVAHAVSSARLATFIARPDTAPAWTGEGLPPVGTACEVRQKTPCESSFDWEECRIAMINTGADGKPQVCTIDKRGDFAIYYPETDIVEFRPIRTPEQIAHEKREAAIDEMSRDSNFVGFPNRILLGALYDAGYKKQ